MHETIYTLKHGFWIRPKETVFDLGLDENVIMPDCSNFSYISGKLIVIKRKNVITIFSAIPIKEKGKKKQKILASFSNTNANIFTNIIIDDICYTIDFNCQVTTQHISKPLYLNPK